MAGMTKLTAVFHNRLVDASKNTTFRNRINSHSQKKKGMRKPTQMDPISKVFLELWAQKLRVSMRHGEK